MSDTVQPGAWRGTILERARAILLAPAVTWPVLEQEPATAASIYRNYIVILAAIPPLAHLLHSLLFGYGVFGITYRPSLAGALATAILHYALTLGGVYVLALIVNLLAPSFDGRKDQVQALKLVAYASTASWLSGIFTLIPGFGVLSLLGLYSLYLFYIGLPVMMKSPPQKTLPYTALVIVAAIVVGIVVAPLSAVLIGISMGSGSYSDSAGGGSVTLPGGASLQMDRIRQAGDAMRAAGDSAGGITPGATHRISNEVLKSFLPTGLRNNLPLTETSSAGGEVGGIGASSAEAKYTREGHSVTLSVTDMGALAALAGLTGALGVNADQQTADSYSRVYQEGSRTVAEDYNRSSHSGSYAIIVASRFMVKAEGSNVAPGDLRNAAKSVDLARLASLAH